MHIIYQSRWLNSRETGVFPLFTSFPPPHTHFFYYFSLSYVPARSHFLRILSANPVLAHSPQVPKVQGHKGVINVLFKGLFPSLSFVFYVFMSCFLFPKPHNSPPLSRHSFLSYRIDCQHGCFGVIAEVAVTQQKKSHTGNWLFFSSSLLAPSLLLFPLIPSPPPLLPSSLLPSSLPPFPSLPHHIIFHLGLVWSTSVLNHAAPVCCFPCAPKQVLGWLVIVVIIVRRSLYNYNYFCCCCCSSGIEVAVAVALINVVATWGFGYPQLLAEHEKTCSLRGGEEEEGRKGEWGGKGRGGGEEGPCFSFPSLSLPFLKKKVTAWQGNFFWREGVLLCSFSNAHLATQWTHGWSTEELQTSFCAYHLPCENVGFCRSI